MRIALAQVTPKALLDKDLQGLIHLCIAAKEQNADLLVTPEMALSDYEITKEQLARQALTIDNSDKINKLCELASQFQLALVIGFAEKNADGHFYNTVILISAEGKILQQYRKTHLFGALDKERFLPGNQINKPVSYGGLNLGLAICYDVEFPELVRFHRQQGCDLLLVPTANMHPFHQVATHMIPTRAMENAMAIAYVNFTGKGDALHYCGYSSLCAPNGERLAQANADEQTILVADVTAEMIHNARQDLTHFEDRRSDLCLGEAHV